MPAFDIKAFLREDSINELTSNSKSFRHGKCFDVSYSLNNSGKWETLENGDRIWRLRIKSEMAYSLNIIFSEFILPDSALLYIYNKDTTKILGAFTSMNNSPSKVLTTRSISGDEVIIEYFEPKIDYNKGSVTIGKIAHDYKGIDLKSKDGRFGSASSCEYDVNCFPLIDEKQAICRIDVFSEGIYSCSGALINNKNLDGKPYVLTANHCICSQYKATYSNFIFNYESSTCEGSDGSTNDMVPGATLISNSVLSDFSLVELAWTPPASFNTYYLGWNRTTDPTNSSVVICIHHPQGDVKKISLADGVTSTLKNVYNSSAPSCDQNTNKFVWHVSEWVWGLTEGGSSGAPLLDDKHRVIGQLYCGASFDCNHKKDDYFGMFSTSWLNTTPATRLKDWLDPNNTGANTMDGAYFIANITQAVYDYRQSVNSNNWLLEGISAKFTNVTMYNNQVATLKLGQSFETEGEFYVPLGATFEVKK